jgi:putative ABC transport system permease protein
MGAGLGILMAFASLDLIISFAERFTSRAGEITLDATVFGYALLAGVGASVFFTLVPTLPDGASVGSTLVRAGTRATGDSSGRRMQRALVVAQIGTSFVLLIGAGLLVRTMVHLERVDPGFDTGEVLAIDIPANTAGRTSDEIRNHYLAVLEDARALPGVTRAALTNIVPLSSGLGGFTIQFEIGVEGFEPASGAPAPRADFRVVSPDFFATMGIEIVRGRGFTSTDLEGSQPVVVINESMARAYFGDRDPIGQRIAWTDEVMKFLGVTPDWRTVVGVAEDTRDYGLDHRAVHTMYNPYPQVRWTESLLVRVAGDPQAIVPALRQTILTHDPNQPIDNVATIAQLGDRSVAPRRLNTILLTGFAALAMLIAAVGLGAVLAFSVGSRVREFGIRSALGAAQHQVWSGVVGEGAVLAGVGLILGLLATTVLTKFISGLLVGVPTFDPLTYLVVALVLAAVVLGACWVPAWRASKVSPMEALGAE